MKKIERFLRTTPSYTKWGNVRLALRTNLSVKTIARFKQTEAYRQIKTAYLSGL
jgi:hypothetical protein